MGGSIISVEKETLRPRLVEFIDMLDGYGVALILAGQEEKDIEQQYVEQDVSGLKVQTVLGKNYRINLFQDDSIEITFSVRRLSYEKVIEFKDGLDQMGFIHRTTYKNDYSGLLLKSVVTIHVANNTEEIMQMFMMFKLE
jgi:hypothetical protein